MVIDNENMLCSSIFVTTSWDESIPSNFLSGIIFTENAIIVYTDGLDEFLSRHGREIQGAALREGRFSVLLRDKEGFSVWNDDMGQDVVFYYSSGTTWGISNSFLALVEKLKSAGLRLSASRASLASFEIGTYSLFGGQLLSNQTPISEIRVLPINRKIRVKLEADGSRSFQICEFPEGRASGASEYEEELIEYATLWRSRFQAIARSDVKHINIDLSGGYDSRVSFALSYFAINKLTGKFNVHSNPRKTDDVPVSSAIKAHYGIEKEKLLYPKTIAPTDAYRLWKYGCIGTYIPIYVPHRSHRSAHVHVHGGHFRTSAYAALDSRKRASVFRKRLSDKRDVFEGLDRLFRGSFDEIGMDFDDPQAMQEHYLNFRARFHYGRSWYKNLNGIIITPLISRRLKSISYAQGASEDVMRGVARDLMLLLDPQLARFPFDRENKTFSKEFIDSSPFSGNGKYLIREDRDIDIYGAFSNDSEKNLSPVKLENIQQEFRRLLAEDLSSLGPLALERGLIDKKIYKSGGDELHGTASHGVPAKSFCAASHVVTAATIAYHTEA